MFKKKHGFTQFAMIFSQKENRIFFYYFFFQIKRTLRENFHVFFLKN